MNERRRQRADCAELACLNVPARQHLRAAVNEPREICGVVRHANEQVLSTSSGGCMRRWRHVCGKVHVLRADNVGMPQLAHEQYLPNRQPGIVGETLLRMSPPTSIREKACAGAVAPRASIAATRGRCQALAS